MEGSILARIDSPRDLSDLSERELTLLAAEIRELIINTTSSTGGHLAASLGTVELTLAIHRALNAPIDKVIWDVGHQAYAHKIITGRRDLFGTLRQQGGLSGFPRRQESEYDVVDSGHAGSSIAYGLGLALARDLLDEDYAVAVVIGDGSLMTGVAFEAMNQAGHCLESNLIIILNDNEMSISRNVGGVASYLSRLRIKPGYTHLRGELEDALKTVPVWSEGLVRLVSHLKETLTHALVPGVLFEAFGLKYVGPIDGHSVLEVERAIRDARLIESPVLLHTVTQKGKGYGYSERSPERFHGVSSFNSRTGQMEKDGREERSYADVFGKLMVELARERKGLVAITAAMRLGTGLDDFGRIFPDRFFDVGIAEQLAVNLAAGFALGGLEPVVAVYSTFLQRAFDQISQEVCLQNLPVVLVVDRAGLVGQDGATHHGAFDISYLSVLPNMTVMAPACAGELAAMLRFALDLDRPCAIRFSRGAAPDLAGVGEKPLKMGRGEVVKEGEDVALLAIGDMVGRAMAISGELELKGINALVANGRFAKPLDRDFLCSVAEGKKLVVTLEDNAAIGGYGSAVLEAISSMGMGVPVMVRGLPDRYLDHGTIEQLLDGAGLSVRAITGEIIDRIGTGA